MFTARNKDGKIVYANGLTSADGPFTCPNADCGQLVFSRSTGIRNRPHFAHYTSECDRGSRTGEWCNESEEHEAAKLTIYNDLLQMLGSDNCAFEKTFNLVGRTKSRCRPDIWVNTPSGVQVAIEIQRQELSIPDIVERTTDLNSLGIAVIWIQLDIDKKKSAYGLPDWIKWYRKENLGDLYYWSAQNGVTRVTCGDRVKRHSVDKVHGNQGKLISKSLSHQSNPDKWIVDKTPLDLMTDFEVIQLDNYLFWTASKTVNQYRLEQKAEEAYQEYVKSEELKYSAFKIYRDNTANALKLMHSELLKVESVFLSFKSNSESLIREISKLQDIIKLENKRAKDFYTKELERVASILSFTKIANEIESARDRRYAEECQLEVWNCALGSLAQNKAMELIFINEIEYREREREEAKRLTAEKTKARELEDQKIRLKNLADAKALEEAKIKEDKLILEAEKLAKDRRDKDELVFNKWGFRRRVEPETFYCKVISDLSKIREIKSSIKNYVIPELDSYAEAYSLLAYDTPTPYVYVSDGKNSSIIQKVLGSLLKSK